VNGARGVIINVTGGPDLSLIEVSEASSIVQEAADEEANIIFGAVVDPALTGRVKITVIATGFGGSEPARSSASTLQTPVDMTPYTDPARTRIEPPSSAQPGERLMLRRSAPRRRLVEMPVASPAASQAASALSIVNGDVEGLAAAQDPDAQTAFDVPAFLRRQEG